MISKIVVALLYLICNACLGACLTSEGIKSAVSMLYLDEDVKRYVCNFEARCSEASFLSQLEVKNILFNSKKEGLLIEPKAMGKQFFSALFLKEECDYRMIFSPDVSMSGIKMLPVQINGMPKLRATERESNDEWSELEYVFSKKAGIYSFLKKDCYRNAIDNKILKISCNSN